MGEKKVGNSTEIDFKIQHRRLSFKHCFSVSLYTKKSNNKKFSLVFYENHLNDINSRLIQD